MNAPAQTLPQLFEQLRASAYSEDDAACIARSYRLAMRLFSGIYRPTGKTFIDHLVGTASVLTSAGASVDIIRAGLLHSAYSHGEFGLLRQRIGEQKRKSVRDACGDAAEELIFRYTALPWNGATVADALAAADLAPPLRTVLLMRLANEVDEHADRALRYHRRADGVIDESRRLLPQWRALAERLEAPFIVEALKEAERELADLPTAARTHCGRRSCLGHHRTGVAPAAPTDPPCAR